MSLSDEELFAHVSELHDKVVLITGAASGIGKSVSLEAARNGAKLVIGDIDETALIATCNEIKALGGSVIGQRCDVASWEDQVSLFQLAIATFGKIHIVIPNAGISERTRFNNLDTEDLGCGPQPTKPDLKPVQINLISVLYSARLAVFYLRSNPDPGKTMVFIGSIASLMSLPPGCLYVTSKHGVLGLAKTLSQEAPLFGIRVTTVCPWFADTAIVYPAARKLLGGLPMTQIRHIVGSIIHGATDPDPATHGAVYTIPDNIGAFRIEGDDLDLLSTGMYKTLKERILRVI
ncbi:NADP-binding protein [Dacryopinax primogenitus]|uniref:NADP-binding protein n=1 Tax=Dacryopinax primogenitus (strain DJM 731) TaxID=1858805 RepID=M5G1D5_DACPD|nr:NADP-binding protein [Dacryopinax primogenitus]EJT97572.1 NADP-binding protein [Dacryopinax primogenitus]